MKGISGTISVGRVPHSCSNRVGTSSQTKRWEASTPGGDHSVLHHSFYLVRKKER